MVNRSGNRTVVIVGGSLVGLAAAAAVAPYCTRVLVIDKDPPRADTDVRRYAPQGSHIHILLNGGLRVLETVLPGFKGDLLGAGVARLNGGDGQRLFEYGAWRPTCSVDLLFTGQSRPLLEYLLSQRVSQLESVELRQGTVERLHVSSDGRIAGVVLSGEEHPIEADLVVDASGAGGRFAKQLNQLMSEPLVVDESPIDIFYATKFLAKPAAFRGTDENVLITPEPGTSNYGGSLVAIEHDRWCLSLHGRGDAKAPETDEAWLGIAAQLADPLIATMIDGAESLTELSLFKKPTATWRRFDECPGLPSGYFPVGDVVNSFNPIFGQGMTLGLKHVEALREFLSSHDLLALQGEARALCLSEASRWTAKAWKQAVAYERNFIVEGEAGLKRTRMLRKLTQIHHQKLSRSEEFFLSVLDESQMVER